MYTEKMTKILAYSSTKTFEKINRAEESDSHIIEREGGESDIVCPEESHIV